MGRRFTGHCDQAKSKQKPRKTNGGISDSFVTRTGNQATARRAKAKEEKTEAEAEAEEEVVVEETRERGKER